jgi:hypothetical protein
LGGDISFFKGLLSLRTQLQLTTERTCIKNQQFIQSFQIKMTSAEKVIIVGIYLI